MVAGRVLDERWQDVLRNSPPWVVEAAPNAPDAGSANAGAPFAWIEEVTRYIARIIYERPFRKKNLLIGYEALRMLLEWGQIPWPLSDERCAEIVAALEAFDSRNMDEPGLVDWVCGWIAEARLRSVVTA